MQKFPFGEFGGCAGLASTGDNLSQISALVNLFGGVWWEGDIILALSNLGSCRELGP